ncbi:MAG: aromatic ring-hydroxylating dioxygenase subunit alpha [Pseudomonadales bacterium]|jgi:phenylpropionate dioxygenase-like ring-hydroxylating dioxygenase large terminal subunit
METSEQIECMKLLMTRLDKGTTVDAGGMVRNPVDAYTSKERALQEWETMFRNYPQVMGLSGDLPEPGSFITSDDLGKPMLMTRDKDGKFQAFLNVCSHRGTVVESEPRGRKNVFSCPFHAWSYSASGDLVSVPKEDHFGPVDKSCNGLVKLTAEEKHGLLWVHPEPGATFNLTELLGDLGDDLDSWGFADLEFGAIDTYETPMNWKFAIDTFGETYHFNVLHKDTLANDIYGNVQCYDTFERNHRMLLCAKSIDLFREMPEEDWDILLATIPVYYLFPNIQLIPSGRHANRPKGKLSGATLVRVYPKKDNPHESFSQISFYTNPEIPAEEREAMSQRLEGFSEIIRDEDYAAAATCHLGATSGAMTHFTFGRNEPALHHYHNTYNDFLGLPPLERISN